MQMDAAALNAFLAVEFPQLDGAFTVLDADEAGLVARLRVTQAHLRPGGTVSGPSMFALADVAVYCVLLSRIGPVRSSGLPSIAATRPTPQASDSRSGRSSPSSASRRRAACSGRRMSAGWCMGRIPSGVRRWLGR